MSTPPFLSNTGLDNGLNIIAHVADPVNPQDAATKAFSSNASNLASGTLAATLLPASGVTAGTYNTVTVDAKGRVTAATNAASTLPVVNLALSAIGTTQGAGLALTGDTNVISTASGTALAVVLPAAIAGKKVLVLNSSTQALSVFPAVGGVIDSLATNAAITLPVGQRLSFEGLSSTGWTSSIVSSTSGASLTSGSVPNSALANPAHTLGSTSIAQGSTVTTVAGLASVTSTSFTGNLTGNVTGNADTATKLATARTFAYTGDVTSSSTFDGTGNVSFTMALATTGVAAGTYNTVTVDAKGRVTAATNAAATLPVVNTGLSATGTTQGTGLVLTGDTNVVSTASGAALALVLPSAVAGKKVLVVNQSAQTLSIFPASGGIIDGLSLNVAISLPSGQRMTFDGLNTTNWVSTLTVAVNGSAISPASIPNSALANPSHTLGSTVITQGATATTLTGLTSVSSTAFVGALTGNASTATALATARTISTTGDATGSASFDGSANAAIALTLANTGVAAGTYNSVTVDAKGRIIAASNASAGSVTSSAITTALGYTPAASGSNSDITALTALTSIVNSFMTLNSSGLTLTVPIVTPSISFNGTGGTSIPNVTISAATPLPLGVTAAAGSSTQASAADHVHVLPSAAQLNVLGLPCPWNPVTNVATLPNASTTSLQANTAPTGDNSFYATVAGTLLVPLTLAGGGNLTSVKVGDIVYYTGAAGWAVMFASANGTTGASVLRGDGAGGFTNATSGVDFGAPITYSSAVPIILAPPGYMGPNGFLTIPTPWIYFTVTSSVISTTYFPTGAWMYFSTGAVSASSPAGFYWTKMSSTGVMWGTLAGGSGYTNGVYQNVPLTGGSGSGCLANLTVAAGVVTQIAFTHQGTGYTVGNVLSASGIGPGTGFTYTVSTLNAWSATGVGTATVSTAGSGYVNGTYTNVPLTNVTGTGTGAQATVVVANGTVVSILPTIGGTGYAAANQLSVAAVNIGGTGTGVVFLVGTVGGPMTGIVYNNIYTPGTNGGVWSTSNTSNTPPTTPTPFTGTASTGWYSTGLYNANPLTMLYSKVPANFMGPHGSITAKVFVSGMAGNSNKGFQIYLRNTPIPNVGALAPIIPSLLFTNNIRQAAMSTVYNRGVTNLQVCPGLDIYTPTNSPTNFGNCDTTLDSYVWLSHYTSSGASGIYQGAPGIITAAGSSYTNGSYTNVTLTGGTGTGMKANITVAGGVVTSVVVTNQGTGYATGASLSATAATVGGTGTGFTYTLNGSVVTNGGSGYTDGTYANIALTGGSGTGAVATITVLSGSVVNCVITNPGSGFVAANTVSCAATIIGSGGSGFVLTVGSALVMPDWVCVEAFQAQAYSSN